MIMNKSERPFEGNNLMKILLFGISNVGESTTGSMLTKELEYNFYNLDERVKKTYHVTLKEFVNSDNIFVRNKKTNH